LGGRKVAPQIQRMKSEDLIAAVFPDQIACLENIAGERQIPDHPLVEQTLDDCLHEAMDSEGWLALLRRMESGEVRLLSRDLPAPRRWRQPFSTRGPMPFSTMPRWKNAAPRRCSTGAGAMCTVATTWARWTPMPSPPCGRSLATAGQCDEMHEALMSLGAISQAEVAANPSWDLLLRQLAKAGRALRLADDNCGWPASAWACCWHCTRQHTWSQR
jgi:ATP-dependent Lhr-like helicase